MRKLLMRAPPVVLQFGLYLVVGGLSSVADVGGFWLLGRFGMPVMAASIASFVAATIVNYLLSYTLAFTRGRYSRGGEIVRFWLVSLAGLTVNTAAMWILTQTFGVRPLVAKLVAVLIVLVWNFIGRRLFVFHKEVPPAIAAALGLSQDAAARADEDAPAG